MEKCLHLELTFVYKTDEEAKEGKKYLERVLGYKYNELDGMHFTRSGRKVNGGKFYLLTKVADDVMDAYLIQVTEILERFEKNFPTKLWDGFTMSTSITYRRKDLIL